MKKRPPEIIEFRMATEPLAPDSMTPEAIIARLAEIDSIGDAPLAFDVSCQILAEYLELEDELERLTDPKRKYPRH